MIKEDKMLKSKGKINNERKVNFKEFKLFLIFLVLILFVISIISAMTIKNVETSPKEIAPGETARITIEIENTLSDDVENVNVALDFSGSVPIAPYLGSSEDSIDEIKQGDQEKFSFEVIALPEAISGVYKIPVKITYDINGTREAKNGTIGVIINSPPKIRISVEGYLIKGQEGTIEVRIVNDGLSNLKLLSVQTNQPISGATINSPLYEYIGNVDSDDFGTVEYKIFARETSPSSISIPIKINYKDSANKDFSQDEMLTVRVYSSEEAKNLGLIAGQSYTLYFIAGIIVILYIIYRIRKRMKRKKALGA